MCSFNSEMRFPFAFLEQRLNIGIATRHGEQILKAIDNSKEKINHMKRISEKISCFYSRDYQIPDQPKFQKLNTKTEGQPPIVTIHFKDIWVTAQAIESETPEEEIEISELKPGKFN